jgi:hypothetical protein
VRKYRWMIVFLINLKNLTRLSHLWIYLSLLRVMVTHFCFNVTKFKSYFRDHYQSLRKGKVIKDIRQQIFLKVMINNKYRFNVVDHQFRHSMEKI